MSKNDYWNFRSDLVIKRFFLFFKLIFILKVIKVKCIFMKGENVLILCFIIVDIIFVYFFKFVFYFFRKFFIFY